ncbi:hypothetical protein [Thermoactinomyces sp. DSM 45891]|uniref:hypothetical protein n=1 Tax=Thermoactinomyces sp. DSM 45891 TaxID=1761907 RepID=UPI0015A5D996|nr:hypothetical protein [Thermoactinomyces sp. DSM 45891]
MQRLDELKRIEELNKSKPVTFEERIEGVGTIKVYGDLDMEKLVRLLLKSYSKKC